MNPPSSSASNGAITEERDPILERSLHLETGQKVVYKKGLVSDMGRIKSYKLDGNLRKTHFVIELPDGEILEDIHVDNLSLPPKVDPDVEKVLSILNLREETDAHMRAQYPSLKEFVDFFQNTYYEWQNMSKLNGDCKELLFKRSDLEEFIILTRWCDENTPIDKTFHFFTKESFNDFRKQAPKDDLGEVLRELGIYNEKVVKTLHDKNVLTLDHLAQKSKSWFEKLSADGEEDLLLNGTDKYALEKFKDWSSFHSIGYLPSDWIVSFRNSDVQPKERELRKVLHVVGLNADAIWALKANGIRDITALNRTSMDWRTQSRKGVSFATRIMREDSDSLSDQWERMGLTRNDASDIINFRHWYKFYVAGKKNMKGWAQQFNSTHFRNFIQRYEPTDHFKKPNLVTRYYDRLRISKENENYYDMLQKAAEAGDVTEEQRHHLLLRMKKREKMTLIEEIANEHEEGIGETSQKEERLRELLQRDLDEDDEKEKDDLLFYQHFCQFFFSAMLVLVLLGAWTMTTVYLMNAHKTDSEEDSGGDDDDLQYITFIHNIVFGLVTAVVIQELGEEAHETSLYYRFLETYCTQKRRSKEYRFRNELVFTGCRGKVRQYWSRVKEWGKTRVMGLILWSTRLYIIFWIGLGVSSLAFGAIEGLDPSNTLYTTGQTWLGIAVTIGYAYFGLSGKNSPKSAANSNENEQQQQRNVARN